MKSLRLSAHELSMPISTRLAIIAALDLDAPAEHLTLTTEVTTPVKRLVYLSPFGITLNKYLCASIVSRKPKICNLAFPNPFSLFLSH